MLKIEPRLRVTEGRMERAATQEVSAFLHATYALSSRIVSLSLRHST